MREEERPTEWWWCAMSLLSSAVPYVGQGEVLGREPRAGDLGGASRWVRPCPPRVSSRLPQGQPSPPRCPPHSAASPAPAGAGAEAAASAPPPGLSRSEQECLSNHHGSPVPSPDVDCNFTYYWCRKVPINSEGA